MLGSVVGRSADRVLQYRFVVLYRLVLNHSIIFVALVCFGCTVCTVVPYERWLWARGGSGVGTDMCVGLTAYKTIDAVPIRTRELRHQCNVDT